MLFNEDVDFEEFIVQKDDLLGVDIKVICLEVGLMVFWECRMWVQMVDFCVVCERVLWMKQEGEFEGLYLQLIYLYDEM